jgi:hypothetical protein
MVVYKTEVQPSTQEPKWDTISLHLGKCGGPNGFIRLTCYDWEETGKHIEIGKVVIEVCS